MLCPICQTTAQRYGKNRNGGQRYRCLTCARSFTDDATRPADGRRLAADKLVMCLRMILEGNSVRSTERLTEVHRDTIIGAVVDAGEKCETFLTAAVKGVPATDVQADEIWGFVGCKERTRERNNYGGDKGDAWCFVALERTNRMVLAWHLDKRTPDATIWFAEKLADATAGRFQLSTDGFRPYQSAIPLVFGQGIDFAQLVKTYANAPQRDAATRYSPGEVIDVQTIVRIGNPDPGKVCTSHSERANLSIRMAVRRMTRLTNAHSKKWENHRAALALWFAYYNFCRVHGTLKSTPAVAADLTDHTWSVAELLSKIGE
jgi:transposase-like protein/IS1 family transposase